MIYVMSDIHGNLRRYRSVISQIRLTPDDHLYVLGDVIDRGPDGLHILSELLNQPNVTVLLGNHEYMMLEAVRSEFRWQAIRLWYRNGGLVTHNAYMELSAEQQTQTRRNLMRLPLTAEITVNEICYLLTHSTPPDEQTFIPTNYQSPAEAAVWTRIRPDAPAPDGKTLVFGHTPTEHYQDGTPLRIWYGEDKIGIDCGSGNESHQCRLACLRLDDMKEFYSTESNYSWFKSSEK